MTFRTQTVVACVLLAFGASAVLAEATDPNVKARQALMKEQAAHTKVLGDMATSKAPFDAAIAETERAALVVSATKIPAVFETQGGADPESEAKPEIWTNWDDFVAKGKALETAATAADVTSLEALQASMTAIGGSCGGCHEVYRVKK